MRIKNTANWKEAARYFKEFSDSGKLDEQEREYKNGLLAVLGPALSDERLDSEKFPSNLLEACRNVNSALTNLTHFTAVNDFYEYLRNADANRLSTLFRQLFDEGRPLAERFDSFQTETGKDYDAILNDRRRMRWFVTVLLAARMPSKYVFYRPTAFEYCADRFGIEHAKTGTNGERYERYLSLVRFLKVELQKETGLELNPIDIHSFLWVEYNRRDKNAPEWKRRLEEWLVDNSPRVSERILESREAFKAKFPQDSLSLLTLETYCLGTENYKEGLSWWLEFHTPELGSVKGGSSAKWGVWKSGSEWKFNRQYEDADDAIEKIGRGLQDLVNATASGDLEQLDEIAVNEIGAGKTALRIKPLSIYFPDKILPIFSTKHINKFLRVFGQDEYKGTGVLGPNLRLYEEIRRHPEFDEFDGLRVIDFLYNCFNPFESDGAEPLEKDLQTMNSINVLRDITNRTRNFILYGPPGTGKTWLADKFSKFLLFETIVDSKIASEYLEAVAADDFTAEHFAEAT
ncbi:MAG: hypothetical protein R2684_14145, partial [Pyrinomonadaceae bacterium]